MDKTVFFCCSCLSTNISANEGNIWCNDCGKGMIKEGNSFKKSTLQLLEGIKILKKHRPSWFN